jgi:hypothetical protein
MHDEARPARRRGAGLASSPSAAKPLALIEGETAALVAADVEQPPRPGRRLERDVAVERQPQAIEPRRMQPAAQPQIGTAGRAGEVVVVAVERDQRRLARARQRLLEAAADAARDGEAAGHPEAGVGDVVKHHLERSAAQHAIGL